jgi:small subunit ribosomal protein S2
MADLPGALFIVDVKREEIAVNEAQKLGIPIIAMVDTNGNPEGIDYPIPANDDALSSIDLISGTIADAIQEGLHERKVKREADKKKAQQS